MRNMKQHYLGAQSRRGCLERKCEMVETIDLDFPGAHVDTEGKG